MGTSEDRFIRIGDTDFTDYDCFIAGVFGRNVNEGTAVPVFVDSDGKLGTVLVDANGNKVPTPKVGQPQAMLNRKVEELQATVAQLTQQLKEQAAQIQKVSAQVEMSKPAARTVAKK